MEKAKRRKRWGLGAKVCAGLFALALLILAAYQGYITVRFRLYDAYKKDLTPNPPYAEATAFAPLADGGAGIDGFQLAMENDTLKFYANAATGNIAVTDKRTGRTLYANPLNADDDPVANGVNKSALKSQLLVTYFDQWGKVAEYASAAMAADLGQIGLAGIPGGVRFTYTFGDTKPKAGVLPLYIKETRLDEVLSAIEDERTRNLLKRRWEAATTPGVMQLLAAIVNNPAQQTSVIKQFEKIGYTDEDRRRDEADSGVDAGGSGFVIPLEYRLDGDGFTATVPSAQIIEVGSARIEGFKLLPFFAAGGMDEEGYLVVPNGSGSLIYFNNGHLNAEDYRQYVYGQDPLLMDGAFLDKAAPVRLPLFGVHRAGQGVLARIEGGAPLAQVNASVAGKLNAYNYVYANFMLRAAMSVTMGATSGTTQTTIPVVEKPKADGDIIIRYTLLDEEYDGYAGMARYERERLMAEGVLTRRADGGDIPFYMDLIGSVNGQKFFLDVPYQGQIVMTTYAQAAEISARLREAGVNNQIINYQGWFNNGYYHDVVDKIKPLRQLGNVKELQALARDTAALGGKLYSDVIFQKVPFLSKRYNWTYENSRGYGSGMSWGFGHMNPMTYCYDTLLGGYAKIGFEVLSPRFLGRYTDSFIKAFDQYGLDGVSLRDMGDFITSDRKRTGVIDRAMAEAVIRANLEKLGARYGLEIEGGNYYALGYADDIVGAPLAHNAYYIVDEEIPFYELIISGCAGYAGEALNLSADYDETASVLKMIEYGASPRFTFTYGETGEMKYTALHPMYATTFAGWEAAAARVYGQVNAALAPVNGLAMVNHETVAPGVKRVTYENGAQITVDYNSGTYAVTEGGAQ